MFIQRFTVMTVATCVLASTADAGAQYFAPFHYGAYYSPYQWQASPSVPALPSVYASLPATNVPTVQPGQTLVPVASSDQTTPSLAVHHPGLGFIGWWQLIQGVWQFVDNRNNGNGGGGGGGGGDSATVQQMKVQVDNNAAKIEQLHGKVDELLNRVPATRPVPPPSTPANTPPAAPSPAPTAAGRLDQIITRLGSIQFKQ